MIYLFYLFALIIIICMVKELFVLLYDYRKRIDNAIEYIDRVYVGNNYDEINYFKRRLLEILKEEENE